MAICRFNGFAAKITLEFTHAKYHIILFLNIKKPLRVVATIVNYFNGLQMKYRFLTLLSASLLMAALPQESFAKSKKHSSHHRRSIASSSRPADIFSALVVDADSGRVLYEKNAEAIRYPASLTKMMTLYLTFDALKHGDLKMDDKLYVSEKAASQPQTNISLEKGDRLPLRTAIESVVVRSANDSATVLGEALGRTEFNFALMMTQKARELGMKDTVFRNSSGLPDNKQHTTALDMAKLGIALRRDFPQYYHFFKLTSFEHNGVTYPGHNHVMERYPGVDGVKTGFIRASGFNLVTSAERNGHRIVAVIMGGSTVRSRDNQMIALLDRYFSQLAESGRSSEAEKKSPKEISRLKLDSKKTDSNS